jgi:hypothetical protein
MKALVSSSCGRMDATGRHFCSSGMQVFKHRRGVFLVDLSFKEYDYIKHKT